jgi:hypothetical protein
VTVFTQIQDGKYGVSGFMGANLFQHDLEVEAGLPTGYPRQSADGLFIVAIDAARRELERVIDANNHMAGYEPMPYDSTPDMNSRIGLLEIAIQYGQFFRAIVEPLLGQSIGLTSNEWSPMANDPYDRIREINREFDNILSENNIAQIVIANRHSGQE